MFSFVVRRLAQGIVTLFVIATLCFAITRVAPGSPFSSERTMHPEIIKNFERFYGLDKPILVQYVRQIAGYLRGDFGPSMYYRDQTCNDFVWPGLRKSFLLGTLAGLLAFALGLPLAMIAAANQNRWPDYLATSASVLGICIPNFLLGPLLVLLFTFQLHWLPSARWPEDGSWSELSKLIMPAVTLAMVHVAYVSRLGRAGMLDVLNKDYIRTARAKGLSEWAVFMKHGLKNGITPVVSYAGPMWALVITGSIVVESVFAIPGLGTHFVKSATNRDMNLIMACVLVYSVIVIFFNFLVDIAYGFLDPRVRVQ
ncbi:MAG: ABC transporter permease [Planctomycetes bacterium]|nr:ABC transporter permease [Planctomycetota bacterium]